VAVQASTINPYARRYPLSSMESGALHVRPSRRRQTVRQTTGPTTRPRSLNARGHHSGCGDRRSDSIVRPQLSTRTHTHAAAVIATVLLGSCLCLAAVAGTQRTASPAFRTAGTVAFLAVSGGSGPGNQGGNNQGGNNNNQGGSGYSQVPEPATLLLVGTGIVTAAGIKRVLRKHKH